jgi:hypothetical protein
VDADEIGRILDEIGERIGPAGEYAFQLAVRQVFIDGAIATIGGVALLVTAVGGGLLIWRLSENAASVDRPFARGFGFAAATAILLGGFVFLSMGAAQLLNPEYHAMMRLLSRLVP